MGDAPGKLPDGLKLLRVTKLLFQKLLLGDVKDVMNVQVIRQRNPDALIVGAPVFDLQPPRLVIVPDFRRQAERALVISVGACFVARLSWNGANCSCRRIRSDNLPCPFPENHGDTWKIIHEGLAHKGFSSARLFSFLVLGYVLQYGNAANILPTCVIQERA